MDGNSVVPKNATFFIAKVQNMNYLRDCHKTGIWACGDRSTPPQPRDILTEAMEKGPVVLIYSVNNCHGWHGCAEMVSKPGTECPPHNASADSGDQKSASDSARQTSDRWQRFKIKWLYLYLEEHGEKCLPSEMTENFILPDGTTPVNNARNWQVLDRDLGYKMCEMIRHNIEELNELRRQKMFEEEARRPPAFFKADETKEDPHQIWKRLTKKVETMGDILLACAFGSQRYNLHTPTSDTDMFIVYAAPTKDVLGFNPPQHTIKNRDVDNTCDYTVHEVHRYAELLISGDPRCIETLFLHPSSIYYSSPVWQQITHHRCLFLTRACCEKYMRDAEGNRGLKLLQKWEKSGETAFEPMTPKVAKLFYIIIRLLQNASEVAEGRELQVYRTKDSAERKLLMDVRRCQCTHPQLMQEVHRLQENIRSAQINDGIDPKDAVEDWLMQLRFENFRSYMGTKNSVGTELHME